MTSSTVLLPGEYVTDLVGDSGSTEQTNLSALETNGLALGVFITHCC